MARKQLILADKSVSATRWRDLPQCHYFLCTHREQHGTPPHAPSPERLEQQASNVPQQPYQVRHKTAGVAAVDHAMIIGQRQR